MKPFPWVPMIPTMVTVDADVPIPPPLSLFNRPQGEGLTDEQFEARWGHPVSDLYFNLAALNRLGHSVLIPGLHRSTAPRLWAQVHTQLANRKGDYIKRQTAEGLRIWKVR